MYGDHDLELAVRRELTRIARASNARTKQSQRYGASWSVTVPSAASLRSAAIDNALSIIDARDETGGRDWIIAIEPDATSGTRSSLEIDPSYPVFIAVYSGADGVEMSLDGVRFDMGPAAQAPRPPFFYASPRGQAFRISGEKARVVVGAFPLANVAPRTFTGKVVASRGVPMASHQSTDVTVTSGTTQLLRPPKYSVAFSHAGQAIGGILATQMDETQAAILPAFALTVPGQRIPLARQCTYLAITNGSGGTLTHTVEWEVFT